jgi:DNA-binding LacI/PurR family transcriptional regulator
MNYRPRASAQRGFQAGTNKSLGLIIKEVDNPYYAEIINSIRSYARQRGYTLLIASSEGEYDAEQQVVDVFKSKDIDGIILIPVLSQETDLSYLYDLKRRNFPYVLLEEIRGVQANLVDIDNEEALKKATRYLIEQGHRRIIHLAGPEYSMHSKERVAGVRAAFSESPLAFREEQIVAAGARVADGYQAGKAFFESCPPEERPTAVTCYNDLVAIGLMRALRELDLDVPDDVSVVGCDDIDLVNYLTVPLTSIRVPKQEMGRRAAEILIDHIESGKKKPLEKEYLESEIVERASTRALNTVAEA